MTEKYLLSLEGKDLSKVLPDKQDLMKDNRLVLAEVSEKGGTYDTPIGSLSIRYEHVTINHSNVHQMVITPTEGEIYVLSGYRHRKTRRMDLGERGSKLDLRKDVRLRLHIIQEVVFLANRFDI